MPADVMVQDWQYWGKYGWNSMRFDEEHYPDPKQMTDSLHRMHLRLMVSVWSKIDKQSEVGRQMVRDNHYIPGTDWIDFFSPVAGRHRARERRPGGPACEPRAVERRAGAQRVSAAGEQDRV